MVRGWRTDQKKRNCKGLENWSDKTGLKCVDELVRQNAIKMD